MKIKFRDGIVKNLEEAIKSADKALTHLESQCRNVPCDLSIPEKRNYTNKVYDNIESFDRFKQNAIIILNEAKALPQTEILSQIIPIEILKPKNPSTLNITNQNNFAYTAIDKIVFCGKEYFAKNWSETLILVTEMVVKNRGTTSSMLINNEVLKGKKRDYFSSNTSSLTRPHQLSNGCFLELNFSAKEIYRICHLLVSEYGYQETDLEIVFSKKAGYDGEYVVNDIENEEKNIGEISEEAYNDPIKMLDEIDTFL